MTAPVIVVASDGSALADHRTQLEPMLRRYAELIEDLAGLPVRVLALDPGHQVQAGLRDLSPGIAAVFLPHARPDVVCAARAGGLPIVTDADTTAIALAAAVLTTLSRVGRASGDGNIVIVGADAMPILCPLLMVARVGDITTWNPIDAVTFPLRRIVSRADVVVDLLNATGRLGALVPDVQPPVIVPDNRRDPTLALPGLLHALTQVPGARLDVEVHHAAALALVMAARPDELLPARADRVLTDRVADAAIRTLHQLTHHPFDPSFG